MIRIGARIALLVWGSMAAATPAQTPDRTPATSRSELTAEQATPLAALALSCVHREYPNKIQHVLRSDDDIDPPRKLTPAFYGCYDWHSAVHGHWLLARLARRFPDAKFAADAHAALAQSLTEANVAGEIAYFAGNGRGPFERPYGLAWLLQLDAELHDWARTAPEARSITTAVRSWSDALRPLALVARKRLMAWFPKLSHPIRTGEHSQTAFAMGLMLDWARTVDDREFAELLTERAIAFYGSDQGWNLAFEPSGQDFLSPSLAEADLMRRVLPPPRFAAWLAEFLPQAIRMPSALPPAVVTDKTDGKLAHLDGLNLARAWMLEGIAGGLPTADERRAPVMAAAAAHRRAGLAAVLADDGHYAGGHWLGSFAVYLVTGRGLAER